MYIVENIKKANGKEYRTVLVLESYREKGKVKHRTIANISKLPNDAIQILKAALKKKDIVSLSDMQVSNGKKFGALHAIKEIAKLTGVFKALGRGEEQKLALLQIASRIISQSSRNSIANEWSKLQHIESVLQLDSVYKEQLYKNLDWLSDNQTKIEDRLFAHRNKDKKCRNIYLYDVTSSYLEGEKNELAAYGYNRDKKKGKKQIVVGLLTDNDGFPLSVEVFEGNTSDTQTVNSQLEKLKKRFGVERVVFVGDKGMVKQAQIETLTSDAYKWNYLTTITKPQIKKLIHSDILQYGLFDNDLVEVETGDIRYICRRNPYRAEEIQRNRAEKIDIVKEMCKKETLYLAEHTRASEEVAKKHVEEKIARLKLSSFTSVKTSECIVTCIMDEEQLKELEKLDGCYAMITDVPKEELSKEDAEKTYKNLGKVESAFRVMKTVLEEIRPIYVIKEKRTRGHVFVCMLAYCIVAYIQEKIRGSRTLKQTIETLDSIQTLKYNYQNSTIEKLPDTLNEEQKEVMQLLELSLPKKL